MLALTPRGLALLFGSQAFVHHHQQDFQQVCARFEHVPYRALTLSACASAFQLTHCLMHTLSVPCIVSITNTLAATAPTPAAAWAQVYPNHTLLTCKCRRLLLPFALVASLCPGLLQSSSFLVQGSGSQGAAHCVHNEVCARHHVSAFLLLLLLCFHMLMHSQSCA